MLYLALSASESAFHIWPKVHSLSGLRRLLGRSGRCSRQNATYGFELTFLAGGAAADAGGAGLLGGAELAARNGAGDGLECATISGSAGGTP